METYDLIIAGGQLVSDGKCFQADIGIRGDRIASIGNLTSAAAAEVVSANGLHVLPGVIDSHVHFRQPGGTLDQEDFESGTRAASLGGVTTVFDMPNTNPPTVCSETMAAKVDMAGGNRSWCNFGFYLGATRANMHRLESLESIPGCCGIKLFMGSSTGDLLIDDDESIARVLANGSRVVAVHSEDEDRLISRSAEHRIDGDVSSHSRWRDAEAARLSTMRLITMATAAKRRTHVLHVSTLHEVDLLAKAPEFVSFEVTPHHLELTAETAYSQHGTRVQINPPLRERHHVAALWDAVRSGLVSTIGSDHAPHSLAAKARSYPASPSGFPGTQTMLVLMLRSVHYGRLSLVRMVDLLCHGPARVFGIKNKGHLKPGYDADITMVDLAARREITADWLASRCGFSPYEGQVVTGWPMATIVGGRFAVRESECVAALGKPVEYHARS